MRVFRVLVVLCFFQCCWVTAQSRTFFSSSLAFQLAATQAASTTLDGQVTLSYFPSWLGWEAGFTFSLAHIEPHFALRFATSAPGRGLVLGVGLSRFIAFNYGYWRIFLPVEWWIPIGDRVSAVIKTSPGLLVGDGWLGLDLPVRFGLSFAL